MATLRKTAEEAVKSMRLNPLPGGETYRPGFRDLDRLRRRFEARLKSITLALAVRASLSIISFARLTSSEERALPSTWVISIGAE